jgi:putative hydrolase of the HAD superfamily
MENIQTFLVDLDGVIVHRADFFSSRAKELYPNANHEAIMQFFVGGAYKHTALGQKDLVAALEEVLPSWGVDVSVQAILDTWFSGENTVDEVVLNRIQELRAAGVKCVIATDHSTYRKNDVWENLGMKNYFDDKIASADIGATKEDVEFYQYAMKKLEVTEPTTLLFTDDDPNNTEVAASLGIKTITFTGIESLQNII